MYWRLHIGRQLKHLTMDTKTFVMENSRYKFLFFKVKNKKTLEQELEIKTILNLLTLVKVLVNKN